MINRMVAIKIESEDKIANDPKTLATLGLVKPRIRLDVDTTKGAHQLRVGYKNAIQEAYPITDKTASNGRPE